MAQKVTKEMVREIMAHDRAARGLRPTNNVYQNNDRPDWWPVEVRSGAGA